MVVNQSINPSHHCKYSGTVAGGGVPGLLVDLAARLVEGRGVGKHQLQVSLHLGLTINNIIIKVLWTRGAGLILTGARSRKKNVLLKFTKISFCKIFEDNFSK